MRCSETRKLVVTAVLCAIAVVPSGRAQTQAPQGARPAPPGAQGTQFPDYPKVDVAVGYRWVEGWPQKPAEAVWGAMTSVGVDGAGNVWTLNRGNIPMQIYRPDGTLVRMWGQGVFGNPHQVRFDKDGNV